MDFNWPLSNTCFSLIQKTTWKTCTLSTTSTTANHGFSTVILASWHPLWLSYYIRSIINLIIAGRSDFILGVPPCIPVRLVSKYVTIINKWDRGIRDICGTYCNTRDHFRTCPPSLPKLNGGVSPCGAAIAQCAFQAEKDETFTHFGREKREQARIWLQLCRLKICGESWFKTPLERCNLWI